MMSLAALRTWTPDRVTTQSLPERVLVETQDPRSHTILG
jgi:hypothetical protein